MMVLSYFLEHVLEREPERERERQTHRRVLVIQLVPPHLRTERLENFVQEKEDVPSKVYPILLHVPERLS